jgi:hypothetical protein
VLVAAGRFCLLGRPQQFAGPPLGPQANLGRVFDQPAVFGLLGVGLHRDGLVADALDLVDRDRLGERASGGVVANEAGAGLRLNKCFDK